MDDVAKMLTQLHEARKRKGGAKFAKEAAAAGNSGAGERHSKSMPARQLTAVLVFSGRIQRESKELKNSTRRAEREVPVVRNEDVGARWHRLEAFCQDRERIRETVAPGGVERLSVPL